MLRQIPNLISILRILLVGPVAWALVTEQYRLGLFLFAVAGISDALDGFLAKRFDWKTRLGGFLDPLADKLLLVATFLSVGWLGLIPWWLVALVILRDIVIVTGAFIYHFRIGKFEADPTPLSKLNTTVQILLVLIVVIDQAYAGTLPEWLTLVAIGIVTITTVTSGLNYVVDWGRRAKAKGGSEKAG